MLRLVHNCGVRRENDGVLRQRVGHTARLEGCRFVTILNTFHEDPRMTHRSVLIM